MVAVKITQPIKTIKIKRNVNFFNSRGVGQQLPSHINLRTMIFHIVIFLSYIIIADLKLYGEMGGKNRLLRNLLLKHWLVFSSLYKRLFSLYKCLFILTCLFTII